MHGMQTTNHQERVLVALKRPEGYSDVHPELVIVDALDHQRPWPNELLRDDGTEIVVALERLEGYEDAPAAEVAAEAINKTWPAWRLVDA